MWNIPEVQTTLMPNTANVTRKNKIWHKQIHKNNNWTNKTESEYNPGLKTKKWSFGEAERPPGKGWRSKAVGF